MERVLSRINLRRVSWNIPLLALVGLVFLGWWLNTPPGLSGKADAVGYAVCHRIDSRSFHLGDRQIAMCARCTGMYLGAMLGLVYQVIGGRRRAGSPPKRVLVLLGALVLAFVIDGLNSYLQFFPNAPHLYEPQNWSRLLTGTGMGLVIAAALFPAFNQSVWNRRDNRPALGNISALGGLIVLAMLLDLLVLTENSVILYPLSLVSAAGVIIILMIVYSLISLVVFRAEHSYTRLKQMWLPLTAGFGMAILQIAVLDLVRFLITGTWEGFHLG
jgi:uncharacterized membrane protein